MFSLFPKVDTYYELSINTFMYMDYRCQVDPPLLFKWRKNYGLDQFEIYGRDIYDDIFAYGETLSEASEMLKEAILPTFWEECLDFNATDKTSKLARIALDLKDRVIFTENKDLLHDGGFKEKGS